MRGCGTLSAHRCRVEDIKVRGGIFELLDVLDVPLARLPIGRYNARTGSGLHYSAFRVARTIAQCSKKEIHERCAAATPVMAHHEDLGLWMLCCFAIELECATVEPAGSRLQVIVETQPDMRELPDSSVGAPAQIDYVGYPKRS